MKRKSYAAAFKTRVAVEAIRGEQTISQIAARFEMHPSQVNLWKKQALQHLMDAFSTRRGKAKQQEEVLKDELYGPNRAPQGGTRLLKNFGSLS